MQSEIILALVGAVLPPLIDLINRFVPNSNLRFIISLVISLVVGAGIALLQYGTDSVLADAGLVFVASQTVYKLIYEKSKLQATVRG